MLHGRLSGAGKTTWALRNMTDETLRIELDAFRIALFGSKQAYFDHPADKAIKSMTLLRAAIGAMKVWDSGKFLISNTNVVPKTVGPFMRFAQSNRLPVHVVVFEAPLDLLLERNRLRTDDDRVPEDRIREMFDDMQNPENQWWKQFQRETITCEEYA